MPKYINADDAIEWLIVHHALIKEERNADYEHTDTYNGMLLGIKDAQKIITDMPSADVVEVVRCKDCKYLVEIDPNNLYVCDRIDIGMDGEPSFLSPENDFCSRGERRKTK